jgi:hypothetical protein
MIDLHHIYKLCKGWENLLGQTPVHDARNMTNYTLFNTVLNITNYTMVAGEIALSN